MKKVSLFPQKFISAITSFLNIDKNLFFYTPIQYIRMISEGSCDTEDWRNGCWQFIFAITGISYILKHITIENGYFKML